MDNRDSESKSSKDKQRNQDGAKDVVQVENASDEQYIQTEQKAKEGSNVHFTEQDEECLRQFRLKEEQRKKNMLALQARRKLMKPAKKQEPPKSAFEVKKERIFQKIQQSVKRYSKLNNVTFSESQCIAFRAQQKQKLFKFILFSMQELKEQAPESLSAVQKQLVSLKSVEQYTYAKTLVGQIDNDFLCLLNNMNRNKAGDKFKQQWRQLTHNIQDEHNLQMRKRIITKEWTSKQMALCSVKDFFSEKRKAQIRRKQQLLLLQSSKIEVEVRKEEEVVIGYCSDFKNDHWRDTQNEKPTYQFIDISTLKMLYDLTGTSQIDKMGQFIKRQLKGDEQKKILSHLNKTFSSK